MLVEYFVILGAKRLYYLTRRPHQSMWNEPLRKLADAEAVEDGELVCEVRLSGLLKHSYRKAA